ncbi:MAG: PspC protein, partial [Solirubrobacterales bacterium]|nr:PspC protein [Solirubrobacterales bacterium]
MARSMPSMTSPTSPTRFLRSRDDRVLGGVAAGLGRSFGVDPLIFRIALAALVFAGGVGILAYGAALLLVPVDDGTGNPEPREQTWRTGVAVAGGALLVIACFAAIGDGGLWAGDWLFPIALVTALGFLVVRALGHRGPGDDTGHSARSTLRTVAIAALVGTAVLVGLAVVFWGSAWATAAGGGVVVAGVVLALGALLVLAAFRGNRGARWLALPAIVIAF